MPLTASQVAQKWARRAGAAEQDWIDGINAYDGDLADAMIGQIDTMLANFIDSIQSGRFEQAVRSKVSTSKWKAASASKGKGQYSKGVREAEGKMQTFMASFLPKVQAIKDSLPPKGNLQQNLERSRIMAEKLAELKGSMTQS